MSSEWVVWLFEGIALGAAMMILFTRSVFHAGLNLLVVVLCLGVIFGLYGSEFLFISQILVYGGGIVVLILFATMVTAKVKYAEADTFNKYLIPILLVAAGVIVLVSVYVMAYQPKGVPFVISTGELGKKLILDYSLPLEVSGVLLLISLIAAILSSIQKPTAP
jgi:NADH:ubiquinone oxidoreductase subunit 6 (subunit J)